MLATSPGPGLKLRFSEPRSRRYQMPSRISLRVMIIDVTPWFDSVTVTVTQGPAVAT